MPAGSVPSEAAEDDRHKDHVGKGEAEVGVHESLLQRYRARLAGDDLARQASEAAKDRHQRDCGRKPLVGEVLGCHGVGGPTHGRQDAAHRRGPDPHEGLEQIAGSHAWLEVHGDDAAHGTDHRRRQWPLPLLAQEGYAQQRHDLRPEVVDDCEQDDLIVASGLREAQVEEEGVQGKRHSAHEPVGHGVLQLGREAPHRQHHEVGADAANCEGHAHRQEGAHGR
mmetsp:Transcript_74486/g.197848  ORF Transcript_74486/g.197848 Transcript_74486/m.197848 type:complete len:224 (+) Transcript_74486:325-996(+)